MNKSGEDESVGGIVNPAMDWEAPFSHDTDHQRPLSTSEDSEDEDHNLLACLPHYDTFKPKVEAAQQWSAVVWAVLVAGAYCGYVIAILVIDTDTEKVNYWCDSDGLVVILTLVLFVGLLYFLIIKNFWGATIHRKAIAPADLAVTRVLSNHWWVSWAVGLVLLVAALLFVGLDSRDNPRRMQSLVGVVVLLLFGYLFSYAPRKVIWRHVAWGMGLQFVLGLMILRWPTGQAIFQCAANKVATFLAFTDVGSEFVFGPLVSEYGIFAFTVLPVILFFGFCIQILYYLGVMQWVVIKLGWCLQLTLGTTACESVNAAANIFLGQTEAPLLIKPYIVDMTKSELHAVMTGGFATIAGSVLAAFISFGVDPASLLSASVMSAPAALGFAKLFYPETRKSKTTAKDIKIVKGEEANLLHAAMIGVTNTIPLVANIAANLIAFYAFIALCSHVIDWACTLAGAEAGKFTLESIFGWVFMPLAWVMGVPWDECEQVGQLIGIKTIVNEFVAYIKLGEMIEAGELSKRAEIIATYALCGFSNISSIGINLGGFSAMAPSRRADLAQVVVRAMIAGSCACFLTACIAGMLLDDLEEQPMTAAFSASLRNLPHHLPLNATFHTH